MGLKQETSDGLKYEGRVGNFSVYVFVEKQGSCPTEVMVSIAPDPSGSISEFKSLREKLDPYVQLVNDALAVKTPPSILIKFLLSPPATVSAVIGEALVAALETNQEK